MKASADVEAARRRSRRSPSRAWPAVACLGFIAGCLSPKPPGDEAPSGAPEPALAPAPPPPAEAPKELPAPAAEADGPHETPRAPRGEGAAPPSPAQSARPAPDPRPAGKARRRPYAQPPAAGAGRERKVLERADAAGPDELRRRLDRAYAAAAPDCPSARERKNAVCDLAAQICSLTDRDPNVASVAQYCDEAKQRCSHAERRTAERCPE